MMRAGASHSLMKMAAVEAARTPMGMRKKRETMFPTYINWNDSSS
jgi:hypothetical protein